MRLLIVSLFAFALSACSGGGPITSVTVRDAKFQVVKVLTTSEDLAEFNRQWQEKKEVDMLLKSAGGEHFELDVERESSGGRWLYYTTGFVSLLSVQRQNVYKMSEQAVFNRLIGAEK